MEAVKRFEIITGAMEVDQVVDILRKFEIRGYLMFRDVVGSGDRSVASPSELAGEFEQRLISTTCPRDQAAPLAEALETFVKRYGGICIASDAQESRH